MNAACSAMRFMRRPSPKRSAFSIVPIADDIADRVPGEPGRPRAAWPPPARGRRRAVLRGRRTPSRAPPRPARGPAPARGVARPSTCSVRVSRVTTSSARSPRRPRSSTTEIREAATAQSLGTTPDRLRPVGRREHRLDRFGERRERVVGLVLLHHERAVGQRDEVHEVALQPGCGRGRDGVPAARAARRRGSRARRAARRPSPAARSRGRGRRRCRSRAERLPPPRAGGVTACAARRAPRATSACRPSRRRRCARRAGAARRAASRGSASPAARACRRAGRSTPSCRTTLRGRARSAPW